MNAADLESLIADDVADALSRNDPAERASDLRAAASVAFNVAYDDAGGDAEDYAQAERAFLNTLNSAAAHTFPDGSDAQADRITHILATAAANGAVVAAAPGEQFEWITMLDDAVRETHIPLHGEVRAAGTPFIVGGVPLMYPGQPVGPPEVWINCRCTLRAALAASADELTARAFDTDKRKAMAKAHTAMPDGSFPIANAEDLKNAIQAIGRAKDPDAAKAHIRRRARALGMADLIPESWSASVEAAVEEEPKKLEPASSEHTGIAMVAKPRNPEALAVEGGDPPDDMHVTLGYYGKTDDPDLDPSLRARLEQHLTDAPLIPHRAKVSGVAYLGDDDPQACVLLLDSDMLAMARGELETAAMPDLTHPHFTPHMTLGYGMPMPASHPTTIDLDHAELWWGGERIAGPSLAEPGEPIYGEDSDDELPTTACACEEVDDELLAAPGTHDGPGWATHPRPTQRLRDYWTKGAGAAKIGWGSPGDLTRCHKFLSKYVGMYGWGTCQNLHKTALGIYNPESRGHHRRIAAAQEDAMTATMTSTSANAGGAHNHSLVVDPSPSHTHQITGLTAASVPGPPLDWFQDPGFDAPTPLTITSDGRVLGHLASWDTCHVGITGECVKPPHSNTAYAYFRTGEIETREGELVATGKITMDTGHAGKDSGPSATVSHYDNTGTAVADVAAGEDAHGIWIAGALRPNIGEQKMYDLRATGALSGDWRRIGGNLELVAALAVNVPGFPVPRVEMAASAGRPMSLTAAAVVGVDPNASDLDRVILAVGRALDQREAETARRARAAALTAQINGLRVEALSAAIS